MLIIEYLLAYKAHYVEVFVVLSKSRSNRSRLSSYLPQMFISETGKKNINKKKKKKILFFGKPSDIDVTPEKFPFSIFVSGKQTN